MRGGGGGGGGGEGLVGSAMFNGFEARKPNPITGFQDYKGESEPVNVPRFRFSVHKKKL